MLNFLMSTDTSIKTLQLIPEGKALSDENIRQDQIILQQFANGKLRLVWEGWLEIHSQSVLPKHLATLIAELLAIESHTTDNEAQIKQILPYICAIEPMKRATPSKEDATFPLYNNLQVTASLIFGCAMLYRRTNDSEPFMVVAVIAAVFLLRKLVLLYPEPTREAKLEKWHVQETMRIDAEEKELVRQVKINEWKEAAWIKAIANVTTVFDRNYSSINHILAIIAFFMNKEFISDVTHQLVPHPQEYDFVKNILAVLFLQHIQYLCQSDDSFSKVREENKKAIASIPVDTLQACDNVKQWSRGLLLAIGCKTTEDVQITAVVNNHVKQH